MPLPEGLALMVEISDMQEPDRGENSDLGDFKLEAHSNLPSEP